MVSLTGKENDALKTRLAKYLARDETGIRKSVLKLFLDEKPYTTQNVFDLLKEQGFDVNYRGISAMVGLMNTRLGVLRIDVKGDHNVYSLKDEYKNSIKATMDNY